MITILTQPRLMVDARAYLAEGPVWDAGSSRLLWVDIMTGRIHSTNPETGATSTRVLPLPVGCIAPRSRGGLVAATADGLWAIPENGEPVRLIEVESERSDTRFNDGRCDAAGRLWAGTMAYDLQPGAGSLYRLDTDLGVERVIAGVTVSNGIDWSLDGRTMYYIDSATQRIDRCDFDPASGRILDRRPFVVIDASDGSPDGLAVDGDDGVWVALWGGWAVRRYTPDGRLDAVINVPAAKVTSLAFGGPDLQDLFITTARRPEGPDDDLRQPHAGGVFQARVSVAGRLPVAFRG